MWLFCPVKLCRLVMEQDLLFVKNTGKSQAAFAPASGQRHSIRGTDFRPRHSIRHSRQGQRTLSSLPLTPLSPPRPLTSLYPYHCSLLHPSDLRRLLKPPSLHLHPSAAVFSPELISGDSTRLTLMTPLNRKVN